MKQRDFFKLGILLLGVTAIAFFVFLLTSQMFIEAFCFASGCGLMCLLQWCAEQKCKDDYMCCEGYREGREVKYGRVYDAEIGHKFREGGKPCFKERPSRLKSCCECQCEKKTVEIKEDDKKLNSSRELKSEIKKTKSRASSNSSSRKKSRKSKKSRKDKRKKLSA